MTDLEFNSLEPGELVVCNGFLVLVSSISGLYVYYGFPNSKIPYSLGHKHYSEFSIPDL